MILPDLRAITEDVARRYNLEYADLAALIDVESSGGRDNNPRMEPQIKDVSLGPAQVLTATAYWLANSGKVRSSQVREALRLGMEAVPERGIRSIWRMLEQPTVGIELGAAYLRFQFSRYGDIEMAVAAYNAGSVGRRATGEFINQSYVDKWKRARQEYETEDDDCNPGSGTTVPSAW